MKVDWQIVAERPPKLSGYHINVPWPIEYKLYTAILPQFDDHRLLVTLAFCNGSEYNNFDFSVR